MAALLLGLLVASAKSSFDTQSSELTQMAASVILLDRALSHYGPATGETRDMLKIAVARMIDQVWPKDGEQDSVPWQGGVNVVYDKIQELVPHSDAQRALQSQAESILINFGQTRLLLFVSRPKWRTEIRNGPSLVVWDKRFGKHLSTTTKRSGAYAFIFNEKGLMCGLGMQGSKITKINPGALVARCARHLLRFSSHTRFRALLWHSALGKNAGAASNSTPVQ
jgi:hypothetical protein